MNFLDAVHGEDGEHGLRVGDLGVVGGLTSLDKRLVQQILELGLGEFLDGLVAGSDELIGRRSSGHVADDGEEDIVVDGRHADRVVG